MQREICKGQGIDPCKYYDDCPAAKGEEGPSDARITIGTHANVRRLDEAAGASGLLIIDEPPELLETIILTQKDFQVAHQMRDAFDGGYIKAMQPALDIAEAYMRDYGELSSPTTLPDVMKVLEEDLITSNSLRRAQQGSSCEGDTVDCAKHALPPRQYGIAPPLTLEGRDMAIAKQANAKLIGQASKCLRTIDLAAAFERATRIRVEEDDDKKNERKL